MSEKQKMLASQCNDSAERELTADHLQPGKLLHVLNNAESDEADYSLSSRATVR